MSMRVPKLFLMVFLCTTGLSAQTSGVIELGTDTVYFDRTWEYLAAIETAHYMESYVFYAKALEAYNKKDYLTAKALVTKAIKLNREEVKFKLLRAWIFSRELSYKKAIKVCNEVLQLREGHQEAMSCKAINQFLLRDYKGAVLTYDQLISINGMDPNAYLGRGNVFLAMDKLQPAIADYTVALQLKPSLALANEGRGTAYFRQFDYPSAAKDFNQFIVAYPESGKGHYFRGLCYLRMNDYSNACRSLQRALELGYRSAAEYFEKSCKY